MNQKQNGDLDLMILKFLNAVKIIILLATIT